MLFISSPHSSLVLWRHCLLKSLCGYLSKQEKRRKPSIRSVYEAGLDDW